MEKAQYNKVQSTAEEDAPAVTALEVETIPKGELQEPAFRDKWWGVAFLVHLVLVIAVAFMYASGSLETEDRRLLTWSRQLEGYYVPPEERNDPLAQESNVSYGQQDEEEESVADAVKLLGSFVIALVLAPTLSIVIMGFMKSNAEGLIRASLYFSIGINLFFGLVALVSNPPACILPFIVAAILFCYMRAVRHRIPFAAANLKTAITVVQANLGMVFLALANIPLFIVWVGCWLYVFASVMDSPWMNAQETTVQVQDEYGYHQEEHLSAAGGMAVIALILSFYWTLQVLKNVVHTSLAGTTGTWWFAPHEANTCCSRGLTDSLCRSLTYSFGSICLGSLIVAIIETLRSILRSSSRNRNGLVRIVAQCLLLWIERIAEYFNRWAFVYVGLYGYSYVEAGKNVFGLFRHRGWTTIINDSLVIRMLWMMCFAIGWINAVVLGLLTWMERADGGVVVLSALWGLFTGTLLSSFVFGVLVSAVDSIVVLYAEAPAEFHSNHPGLAREMEDAWMQGWPDVFTPAVTAPVMNVV